MKAINKKLAYGLWAVSGLSAVMSIINYLSFEYYLGMIGLVVALVFQCLLGYTILRDRNDSITVVSVLLVAIFTFNLGGLVAIVMRLVLRKKKESEKIRSAWFVPAIVAGVMMLINIMSYISLFGVVGLVLNVAYYLIFGYWFIKYLEVN